MDFLELKFAGLLESKSICLFFQVPRLLSCHCYLVFKLFSLILQRFGNVYSKKYNSSLTESMFKKKRKYGRVMPLIRPYYIIYRKSRIGTPLIVFARSPINMN